MEQHPDSTESPTQSQDAQSSAGQTVAKANAWGVALLLHAVIMLVSIAAVAAVSHVATISRVGQVSLRPTLVALAFTMFGTVPALAFGKVFSNGSAAQLAVVAWRMAIMVPSLMFAVKFVGLERICFLNSLLACYFVALVLESGLLIRDARLRG